MASYIDALALKDNPMSDRQLKAEIIQLKEQIQALENTIKEMNQEKAKHKSLWIRFKDWVAE